MPSLLNRIRGKRKKDSPEKGSERGGGTSILSHGPKSSSKPTQHVEKQNNINDDDDNDTQPLQEQSPPSHSGSFDDKSFLYDSNKRDSKKKPSQYHKRQNLFSYRKSSGKIHKTTPGHPHHAHASPRQVSSSVASKPVEQSKRRPRPRISTKTDDDNSAKVYSPKSPFGRKKSAANSTNTPNEAESSDAEPAKWPQHAATQAAPAPPLMTRETERIARAAAALDNKGNELFERGLFDRAMATYTKALKLKRRTFHVMLDEVEELLEESDNLEDAVDENKINRPQMDEKLLVSMATSINNIGYLRQRSGEATPDETMSAYKKSLRIKRKILGNDSLSVGKTLNNIGSVYYVKHDFHGALAAYDEALHIMQSNLGASHPDVATVWSNRGDVYLGMADKASALLQYRQSLTIRWDVFGEHDPRVVRLLEKIAAIEVGEYMLGDKNSKHPGEWADESDLFELDYRPVDLEWHLLHDQVEEDLQFLDLLQKRMAVDMVKDKVLILRGMRELLDESNNDNASAKCDSSIHGGDNVSEKPKARSKPNVDRDEALRSVKSRLARIRERRSSTTADQDGNESFSTLDQSTTSLFGSSIYSNSRRVPTLSGLQAEELKGGVDSVKSALVLKQGIASLRSFHELAEDD